MTYTLPNWQDSPSTATPLNSSNLSAYNTAVNGLDTRVSDLETEVSTLSSEVVPLATLDARYVGSVTAGDSSMTVGGSSTSPTVAVNQGSLSIAPSQVSGLSAQLSLLNSSYSQGGMWGPNVYGDLMSNMERDDATSAYLLVSGTSRTLVSLIGWSPSATYSVVKFYETVASGSGGVMTLALYTATSISSTSWTRLGSGNVTQSTSTAGLITVSLPFTLASPAYVLLQMVLTTAPTSGAYPTLAVGGAVAAAGLLSPGTGLAPVSAISNGTSAPGSTLNPTTGFTAFAQKIWCALA